MPNPQSRYPSPKEKVTREDLQLSARQKRWALSFLLAFCLAAAYGYWWWQLGEREPTASDYTNLYLMVGFLLAAPAWFWIMRKLSRRGGKRRRQLRRAGRKRGRKQPGRAR